MLDIAHKPEYRRYVIATSDDVSCFCFDNARDHARGIAECRRRPDQQPRNTQTKVRPRATGRTACRPGLTRPAAGRADLFGPGGRDELARRRKPACLHGQSKVRLVLGNTRHGVTARKPPVLRCAEHSAAPRKCRSRRSSKRLRPRPRPAPSAHRAPDVPPSERPPARIQALTLRRPRIGPGTWRTVIGGSQGFADTGKAGAYIVDWRGASVEPRIFR